MKPRSREINIFNLSMMDVICGALGAFLIILVVLIPYYKQGASAKNIDEAKKLKAELEQTRRELVQAKSQDAKSGDASEQLAKENQQLKKQLADARQQLEKSADKKPSTKSGSEKTAEEQLKKLRSMASDILTITAFWDNPNVDVDLWVKFGAGVWGGPKKQTPDGKRLSHQFPDKQQGPGFETFTDPGAGGRYEVYYRLARRAGGPGTPVSVNTRVSWLGLEADKYGTEYWTAETKLNADGLIPAFMISFGKDGIKLGPLNR